VFGWGTSDLDGVKEEGSYLLVGVVFTELQFTIRPQSTLNTIYFTV
jgi:hypothetical protein